MAGVVLLCALAGAGAYRFVGHGGPAAAPAASAVVPSATGSDLATGPSEPVPSEAIPPESAPSSAEAMPPDSPTPGASDESTGRSQAEAVDALLDASAADRQQVLNAVQQLSDCRSVDSSRATLSAAADHRDELIDQLDSLRIGLIEGGAQTLSILRTAWEHSAAADRAFAAWASNRYGCQTGPPMTHTDDYDRALDESTQASRAKAGFAEDWTRIAAFYGLPARSADQL